MGQGRWIDDDKIWRNRTPSFPCHESTVPRNAQKQRMWKIINTLLCRWGYDWNCFSTFISVNQLGIYGASLRFVWSEQSLPCKNRETCTDRTIWPIVWASNLLTKTPTPSTNDPAQEDLLRKYQERVERLSHQNRVNKICTDARFLTTVGVGQYFVTKDTEEFSQFTEPVACREYTLPRDEKSSDPKGWIRVNTKIGCVLEVTTSYLRGKYGVEIRIESVNKDNSHSWVRISHELNKVGHWVDRQRVRRQRAGNLWDEVWRICVEDQCTCFCKPNKGWSKTTQTYFCLLIYKNCRCRWKILDWYWAKNLFAYRLSSFNTTEYSSLSWWSTSRRWWSDWILEIKRWSSERIWVLSTLVWWNVEA